jgi:hypothetical protein
MPLGLLSYGSPGPVVPGESVKKEWSAIKAKTVDIDKLCGLLGVRIGYLRVPQEWDEERCSPCYLYEMPKTIV